MWNFTLHKFLVFRFHFLNIRLGEMEEPEPDIDSEEDDDDYNPQIFEGLKNFKIFYLRNQRA